MLTGTIINSLAILAGSLLGLVLQAATHRSSKDVDVGGIGGRLQTIVMEGMSLCVLYIGISGSLKGQNTLIAIISIAIGAVVGELLDLDRRMHTLGDWVQAKTARFIHTQEHKPCVQFVLDTFILYILTENVKWNKDIILQKIYIETGVRFLMECMYIFIGKFSKYSGTCVH